MIIFILFTVFIFGAGLVNQIPVQELITAWIAFVVLYGIWKIFASKMETDHYVVEDWDREVKKNKKMGKRHCPRCGSTEKHWKYRIDGTVRCKKCDMIWIDGRR